MQNVNLATFVSTNLLLSFKINQPASFFQGFIKLLAKPNSVKFRLNHYKQNKKKTRKLQKILFA